MSDQGMPELPPPVPPLGGVVPYLTVDGAWEAADLGAGWLPGTLVGLYRQPSRRRLLATWIVAVPLAWLVRALVLGRELDGSELAFLGVSLAFTLPFVAVARLVA